MIRTSIWQTKIGNYRNADDFLQQVILPTINGDVLGITNTGKKSKHFAKAVSYIAVRNEDDSVSASVVLIIHRKDQDTEYCFKIVSENECPFYFSCPQHILDLLSATKDENAQIWRNYCFNNLNRKVA